LQIECKRIAKAQVNVWEDMGRYGNFFQVSEHKKARLNWANVLKMNGGGAENRILPRKRMTCDNSTQVQMDCKQKSARRLQPSSALPFTALETSTAVRTSRDARFR
jgi:hypothetical protein